jgi:hypothetical protein
MTPMFKVGDKFWNVYNLKSDSIRPQESTIIQINDMLAEPIYHFSGGRFVKIKESDLIYALKNPGRSGLYEDMEAAYKALMACHKEWINDARVIYEYQVEKHTKKIETVQKELEKAKRRMNNE